MTIPSFVYKLIPPSLRQKYANGSERSRKALVNIIISVIMRGVSIIVSLLLVPLTINYVNPTRYGIWLTLSSIVGWVGFLDLGLGNGFRNRFAESLAKGDKDLAKQYVSTTYFAISTITVVSLLLVNAANYFIDWPSVLHVDPGYKQELTKVFAIVASFFCLNFTVRLVATMFTADQKPSLNAVLNGLGDILSLLVIFILTRVSEGSLVNLALFYSGIPCLVMIIATFITFTNTSYKQYAPSWPNVKFSLLRNIFNLGIAFFIIHICMIAIFQIINIVISRELGPDSVTQYNIAYKYFSVLNILITIILTPLWSASTEAYVQKDFQWLRSITKKLELLSFVLSGIGLIMLAVSNFVYDVWIGDSVSIPFSLSLCLLIYCMSNIISSVYMNIINGIGCVRLQTIIYIVFGVLSWPLMTYSCRLFGLEGVLLVPGALFFAQALLMKIQLNKLIAQKATGLWAK